MSNIFKTNSRFAALIDDIPPSKKKDSKIEKEYKKEKKEEEIKVGNGEEKFNSFKSERRIDTFRYYNDNEREMYRKEREKDLKAKQEFEEKEKERKKIESLNINNFPELIVIPKKEEINDQKKDNMNFVQRLKKENVTINNIDPDLVNLKPGWILLKKDEETRRTVFKKHTEDSDLFETKIDKYDYEIYDEIINSLIQLHEKRTQEYIELNGYDNWENMFKFPNWQEEENDSYSDSEEEDLNGDESDYEYDEYY
jgi:hypothetical protein